MSISGLGNSAMVRLSETRATVKTVSRDGRSRGSPTEPEIAKLLATAFRSRNKSRRHGRLSVTYGLLGNFF